MGQTDTQQRAPEIAQVISLVAEILVAERRRQAATLLSTPATGHEVDREAA